MRPLHALLHAMRKRRHRIDLNLADRLVAGDPPGSDHPGLGDLLDAVRAPGTPEELTGEKAVVAAFAAHRKRAARADRRATRDQRKADRTRSATARRPRPEAPVTVGARGAPIGRSTRKPKPRRARAAVAASVAGLALLALSGTAVAARTGNLPREAQQHAHRLFSALGVPAPRTGPTPSSGAGPSESAGAPSSGAPSAGARSSDITALPWCEAWRNTPGEPAITDENRRKLRDAAGGEERIDGFCEALNRSASSPATPSGGSSPAPPSGPGPTPAGTGTPQPSEPPAGAVAPSGGPTTSPDQQISG